MKSEYIELELAVELQRLKAGLKNLKQMNSKLENGTDRPRGIVERQTVDRANQRILSAIELYEQVIDKHVGTRDKELGLRFV